MDESVNSIFSKLNAPVVALYMYGFSTVPRFKNSLIQLQEATLRMQGQESDFSWFCDLKMIAAVELQYAVAQKILIMRLNGIHFRAEQIVFGNLEFRRG